MTINVPASGLFTINVTAPEAVTLVEWDFGDGTTASGLTATHDYAAPGDYIVTLTVTLPDGTSDTSQSLVVVTDPLLLDLDVVSGALVDQSSYAVPVSPSSLVYTTGRNSGGAFEVDTTHGFSPDKRDTPHLFSLDNMSIYVGFRATVAGTLIRINSSWDFAVNAAGELTFDITNSDGTAYSVASSGAGLLDGNWHDVTVVWQGWTDGVEGGALTIYIDGVEADTIVASGTTQAVESWGIYVGSAGGGDLVGEIDHIRIYGEAQTAGEVAAEHGAV